MGLALCESSYFSSLLHAPDPFGLVAAYTPKVKRGHCVTGQHFVLNHCAWFVRQEKRRMAKQVGQRQKISAIYMGSSTVLWLSSKLMFFIWNTILCAALTDRIWVYMLHPSRLAVFAVLMSPVGCASSGLRQNCWGNRNRQLSFLKPGEKLDSVGY